ncbi:MAG: MarC family protein [Victivallales bacterium]|nr:MarC family protein [Victivallales bacterium]
MLNETIEIFIKLFFLLTPFFVLSMFITMTGNLNHHDRHLTAAKTTAAIWILSLLLYFCGNWAFGIIGITLDAFRIGTGCILMISAVELVLGKAKGGSMPEETRNDIAVVPLAIPYALGPGTIGTLMVMGGETAALSTRIAHLAGITFAVILTGVMLFAGVSIEKFAGRQGINILCKITGLVLASIAAQVIFTGIKNFLYN